MKKLGVVVLVIILAFSMVSLSVAADKQSSEKTTKVTADKYKTLKISKEIEEAVIQHLTDIGLCKVALFRVNAQVDAHPVRLHRNNQT